MCTSFVGYYHLRRTTSRRTKLRTIQIFNINIAKLFVASETGGISVWTRICVRVMCVYLLANLIKEDFDLIFRTLWLWNVCGVLVRRLHKCNFQIMTPIVF